MLGEDEAPKMQIAAAKITELVWDERFIAILLAIAAESDKYLKGYWGFSEPPHLPVASQCSLPQHR
ncbi:MAG: hypothetical protein U0984_11020 [Prosthecobacter sp.]|nr:hypothetical protein [Prosthecobacter sp.]